MATLEEKLRRIIADDLQGRAELETLPNGHVCGVVSPLFEGKDYYNRRVLIREALRKHKELSDEEQLRVSTLLTYTPSEWKVVLTDTVD